MDRQNRVGHKHGGMSSQSETDSSRRERLRKLAMETIDLKSDPYIMRNHLGSYECKLCLTLHPNEGSYLAHTQGKKHTTNLAIRAAKEAREQGFAVGANGLPKVDGNGLPVQGSALTPYNALGQQQQQQPQHQYKRFLKIGRPGFKVVKVRDPATRQLGLLFQLQLPSIAAGVVPRHRFMSAYEQKMEAADRAWQYLLVAAEPYETLAFKIPAKEIDAHAEERFWQHWDEDAKVFTMQFFFVKGAQLHR